MALLSISETVLDWASMSLTRNFIFYCLCKALNWNQHLSILYSIYTWCLRAVVHNLG